MLIVKSTDGGASFGTPVKVSDYYDLPDCLTYTGQNAGRACVPTAPLSNRNIFRATNYPVGVAPSNSTVFVTLGSYINRNSNPARGNCTPDGFSATTGLNTYQGVGERRARRRSPRRPVVAVGGAHPERRPGLLVLRPQVRQRPVQRRDGRHPAARQRRARARDRRLDAAAGRVPRQRGGAVLDVLRGLLGPGGGVGRHGPPGLGGQPQPELRARLAGPAPARHDRPRLGHLHQAPARLRAARWPGHRETTRGRPRGRPLVRRALRAPRWWPPGRARSG